jgi:hypothetical protein
MNLYFYLKIKANIKSLQKLLFFALLLLFHFSAQAIQNEIQPKNQNNSPKSPVTWYSVNNGNWSNPGVWSKTIGDWDNTSNEIPSPVDNVVIQGNLTVTVDINNITINSFEVRSGTLDLVSTTGHNFNTIFGEGTIRMSADNFPAGDASGFTAADKGTVVYYGLSFTLNNTVTFNNLIIDMTSSDQVLTLLTDYTLNGNLTIQRGNLRINNNSSTTIRNLTINGNLIVNSNGQISVGTGNTKSGYTLQWWLIFPPVLPPSGQYHSIYHQVKIGGDMTVQSGANVRFTNLSNPLYNEFADNGGATITFFSAKNSVLELNDRVDFYNLIIDKGNDRTFILDVQSGHSSYFNLYGPNIATRNTNAPFSEKNPEVRKALWIRNGTLKLSGSIHIATLTEGYHNVLSAALLGSNGDYAIGSNAKLWIVSPDVTVYTTIQTGSDDPNSGTGFRTGSTNTALSLYGKLRVDNGFFGTRHSAGFIFWEGSDAFVEINGGIVDISQFRSSTPGWFTPGGGGYSTYLQTGGQMRVRGGIAHWGAPAGGEINTGEPIFGIKEPTGVFNLQGGHIYILRGAANSLDRGLLIASEDYNVTGGTISLILRDSDNFFISTKANLWNLQMTRLSGGGTVNVRFTSELTVSNDLLIGDNCIFHPRAAGGQPIFDLHIGRNFALGQTAASNAAYEGSVGNITRFFGNSDGVLDIMNNDSAETLEFFTLEIDKSTQDAKVTIVSDGRATADVNTYPYASPIEISNRLTVSSGVLDYNGFAIVIDGSQELENNGTIGLIDDTGFLALTQTVEQFINLPLGANPVFGRIVIDNSSRVSLSGAADATIGDLYLRRGFFNIGIQGITVENEIHNLNGGGAFADFGEGKLILTAGNHSDRGLTLKIPTDGTYLFPIGSRNYNNTATRYAFAQPTLSDVPAGGGYLQINGVPRRLATLGTDNPQRYLRYYWRLRHTSFSAVPDVDNYFRSYLADYNDYNQIVVGKVVDNIRTPQAVQANIGVIIETGSFRDLSYDRHVLEIGEFTAARKTMFNGEIQVYYSKSAVTEASWTSQSTWTRSGVAGFDPNSPHRSNNPDPTGNPKTPQIGDIAIIGYVPWDDPNVALRGKPHAVVITGAIETAKIEYTQMKDSGGDPAYKNYRSNFQFQPTIILDGAAAAIDMSIVEGNGTIWLRNNDADFSEVDLGDFAAQDSAYFVYQTTTNNRLYNNLPNEVPNLMLASSDWGADDYNLSFSNSFLTRGNLDIAGNVNLHLENTAAGDITVGGNLRMIEISDASETDPTGGGAELVFQNSGTARSITVSGDLILENEGAHIYVNSPNTTVVQHSLNVFGNIIQDTDGAGTNGLQFYSALNQDRIILNLFGSQNRSWDYVSGSVPSLYGLNVSKGNSQNTTFTINSNFTLNGANNGTTANKALQLINGSLILNHPDIDITLSSGGEYFNIPSTSALVVSQGAVSATGSDARLGGLLRIENNGVAEFDNTLQYAATGLSRLQIVDDATLSVGRQIRSATSAEGGILKYSQSGGKVRVGYNNPDEPTRGVFEVFSPGSEFIMTGGELSVVGSQGVDPDRAALYISPTSYNISSSAIINIGEDAAINDIIEIDIASYMSIPSLTVRGDNITAKLRNNHLAITGDLDILSDNAFNGNNLSLTLSGDLNNAGTPALNTDTLSFNGVQQFVIGAIEVNHMMVRPSQDVNLSPGSSVLVAKNLYINTGVLKSGENTVTVLEDVYNYSSLENEGTGGILFTGTNEQRIFGNGLFGRMEIDKTAGLVSLYGQMELTQDLVLTQGNLHLGLFRLTLGLNSEILGGAYGLTRMITTTGSYESRGLAKRIPAGAGSFTFPIGVLGKYTPVELTIDGNTNEGLIAVTPVDAVHMTISPDPIHGLDVLDYHWAVESIGINNFSGRMQFHFNPADVNGNIDEYIAARLIYDEWAKFPEDFVNADYFYFEYINVSDISGDYTAGVDEDIPDDVPTFISASSGLWTIGTNWRNAVDGTPAPDGGPAGVIVEIEPGHTITIAEGSDRRIAYELTLNGTLDVGATINHNFRTLRGNGWLRVERSLPFGRLDNFFSTPGSTIEYSGSVGYTISDRYGNPPTTPPLQNLVISGSGEWTLPANHVWVYGNISIEEEAILVASHYIQLLGNMSKTIDAGFRTTNYVAFRGTNPQSVSGSFTGVNTYRHIWVRNNAGVNFDSDTEVSSLLYLQFGIVNMLNDSKLIHNGSINAGSYTEYYGSWINGKYSRKLANSSTNNLFMIGKNLKPRYTTINSISHGAGSKFWTVEYHDTNPLDQGMNPEAINGDPTPLVRVSDVEFWEIDGPAGGSATVQINWGYESGIPDDDQEVIKASTVVAEWNASAWTNKGNNGSVTVSGNGVWTTGTVNAGASSSFSTKYFTIATTEANNPLPVEFLSVDAFLENNFVVIEWATATERNNNFFTVERSKDGVNFEIIAVIPSQSEYGYSNRILNYSATDTSPFQGVGYYRIKQTDFDGKFDYSNTVGVYYHKQGDIAINLYPNPNRGNEFNIVLNGLQNYESVVITITDLYGKPAQTEFVYADDQGRLIRTIKPHNKLAQGVYILSVSTNSGRYTTRMVVN